MQTPRLPLQAAQRHRDVPLGGAAAASHDGAQQRDALPAKLCLCYRCCRCADGKVQFGTNHGSNEAACRLRSPEMPRALCCRCKPGRSLPGLATCLAPGPGLCLPHSSDSAFSTISLFSNMPAVDTPAVPGQHVRAQQWLVAVGLRMASNHCRFAEGWGLGAQAVLFQIQGAAHKQGGAPLDCRNALSCATDMCCTSSLVGGASGSTLPTFRQGKQSKQT